MTEDEAGLQRMFIFCDLFALCIGGGCNRWLGHIPEIYFAALKRK